MRVIFRKWPTGDIIALLPDVEANRGMVMMYEHTGQHGEGSASHVISYSRPASAIEYAPLLRELSQIYAPEPLTVSKRIGRTARRSSGYALLFA